MDFTFTEEQEMLRKMVRDFLTTECPRDTVKEAHQGREGIYAGALEQDD